MDPMQQMSSSSNNLRQSTNDPYIDIIEQPDPAKRFRYKSEGPSAGSIPGVNSTNENKTFPAIQIVGYKGRAVVVVSCVTKDRPYRPHPHNLVGKDNCKKGICTIEINNESMIATFQNLGIQCAKNDDIHKNLTIREKIQVDPFMTGFSHKDNPSTIDLNAVRLCFQAFLKGSQKGKYSILKPVVSEPIYDKKAMSDLVICKLSHASASVLGNDEVILLCEKVNKDDIKIRFYEENDNGICIWQSFADFQPSDVHKQVAICFRTPKYRSTDVQEHVKVKIQLVKSSDGMRSEPRNFILTPGYSVHASRKRPRLLNNYISHPQCYLIPSAQSPRSFHGEIIADQQLSVHVPAIEEPISNTTLLPNISIQPTLGNQTNRVSMSGCTTTVLNSQNMPQRNYAASTDLLSTIIPPTDLLSTITPPTESNDSSFLMDTLSSLDRIDSNDLIPNPTAEISEQQLSDNFLVNLHITEGCASNPNEIVAAPVNDNMPDSYDMIADSILNELFQEYPEPN